MNSIYDRIFGSIDESESTIDENVKFDASLDDLFCFANEDYSEFNKKYMNSILTEAPEDVAGGGDQTPPDNDQNPGADQGEDGGNDNFDIDTDLDNGDDDNAETGNDNIGDDSSGDSMEDGLDDGGGDTEGDSGNNDGDSADENNDEDTVQDNEDIFYSLSAEEQQIKIMELKKQYSELYNSCDDILDKINDLGLSEIDIHTISKVSNTLYNLKAYISDYLYNLFPNKSYFENDVAYNTFLNAFNSVQSVLAKLADQLEKQYKDEEKKKKSNEDDIDEYLM